MRAGHLMQVPNSSLQSWLAAFTGSYDDVYVELLCDLISPDSIVLDVGASLGFYSIPLSLRAMAKNSRVIAFEPVPRNVATISRNRSINNVSDVLSVVALGLGATPGTVQMTVEKGGAGNAAITSTMSLSGSHEHFQGGHSEELVSVDVVRLDDYLKDDLHRCSLLKIDVEGFELDVLDGAETLIRRSHPVIFGEFSPDWLRSRGKAPDAILDWAEEHDYACYELRAQRTRPWSDRQRVNKVAVRQRTDAELLLVPSDKRSLVDERVS